MTASTVIGESTPVIPTQPEASSAPVVETTVIADPAAPAPATPAVDPGTSTPSEGDTTQDPSATEPTPKPSRAQERIEDLVAERNAIREYAEFWRTKALEGTTAPTPAAPVTPAVPDKDPAPKPEDFDFDTQKLAEAQAAWTERQISKRVAAEVQKAIRSNSDQQTFEGHKEKYQERIDAFAAKTPDFRVVMSNPRLPQLHEDAARLVVASDLGAEVTYHLGRNPDKLARIARMSPVQQAQAIGRLEAELKMPTPVVVPPVTKPVVTPTRAPAPPTPVVGGSGTPALSMEALGPDEWATARRAELKAKKRR